MDVQHIDTVDPTSPPATGSFDPGPTIGCKLLLEGTTSGGNTLTLGDVADRLIFSRDGTPFMTLPFEWASQVDREWFGDVDLPSGGADATERVVAFIYFFFPQFFNGLEITGKNELEYTFQWNAAMDGLGFSNPTVKIEQLTSPQAEELYTPFVATNDIDISSTTAADGDNFTEANLYGAWFRAVNGAAISNIDIEVDGRNRVANTDLDGLRDIQRQDSQYGEGAADPAFARWSPIDGTDNLSQAFSRSWGYHVQATSGGDLEVVRARMAKPKRGKLSEERILEAGAAPFGA